MSVKNDVLAALLKSESSISGNELAEKLGVTRNSVWKAVNQLKNDGYTIEAVTNRGYRLLKSEDIISEPAIKERLTAARFGKNIEIHKTLSSTNDRAKELAAAGAADGTVVIADNQSGGKGRRGRSFFSPPASGIYLSLIIRPEFSAELAGHLTSCAALAVAEAIEKAGGPEIGIKWVNDLYCNGKKLCGILSECSFDLESGTLEYAVIGIGVNVGKTEFPPELADIATSVYNQCGKEISRNLLIAGIINNLEKEIDKIDSNSIIERCRRRSVVIGKEVTVTCGNSVYEAKAVDIDNDGRLLVERDGVITPLGSGEVSVKPKKS